MKKNFNKCLLCCAIIFVSCSREKENTKKSLSNKAITISNKNLRCKNNIVIKGTLKKNSLDISKINSKTKKYDELWDLLTTGGINNTNLTEKEKNILIKSYNAYNKVINNSNFFALQYDKQYMSLTNRILTDNEIQLLIDNLDLPTLIRKAGNLYLGYEMVRDVYAAEKILSYVISAGNDQERLYAQRKLAEFLTMPFIKNRDLPKTILLYNDIIDSLNNKKYHVEKADAALNIGWAYIGLAQCNNALGQYDKEQKVYDDLANYLEKELKKNKKQIELSVAFAKNIVIYREKLPKNSKKLNELKDKFENILNEIDNPNDSPLASKCKSLIKELRRKSLLIKK